MSPYGLLQEELESDPWKIFVCCIFCNLTKRRSAEPFFWKVLDKWPNAYALSTADRNELKCLIEPLGLSERRSKALIRMSYEYNRLDWKTNPAALYGIGKYGSDAYHMFCTDKWKDLQPTDGALKNYLKYLKSIS